MKSNPNAVVSVYTGAATIILVWLLQASGFVEVPDYVAQAITVCLTGLVLLTGRRRSA